MDKKGEHCNGVQMWNCENDRATFLLLHDLYTHKLTTSEGNLSSNILAELQKTNTIADFTLFTDLLHSKGVDTISITDTIMKWKDEGKEEFIDFIVGQLECVVADFSAKITAEEILRFKRNLAHSMSPEQLRHAITHVYTFTLYKNNNDVVVKSYSSEPLTDLLQVRAQLFTPKGVVMSSASSVKHRVNVLRKCVELLGFRIVAKVPDPLRLSGGDYVPAGPDLAFMGVGPMTDEAAVRYILDKDGFGTRRVAVVRDLFDRSDSRRYLDTVFQLIGPDCAVIAGSIVGKGNLRRRLVNEYTHTDDKYHLTRMGVEFSEYLKELGVHLIEIPESLHDEVGIPIFNIGGGNLIIADERVAAVVRASPHFKGTIQMIEFKEQTEFEYLAKSTLVFRKPTEGSSAITVGKSSAVGDTPIWRPRDGRDVPRHQTTHCILMVAPIGFQTNEETAKDNYFMNRTSASALEVEHKALREFSTFHHNLAEAGVTIFLQCSERFHKTPDAVFPNNWFSTHACAETDTHESLVVFYPMKTESRRAERRQNIVSDLVDAYQREISFTQWEYSDFPHFLESTGVLIMDRIRKIAYITLSQRCNARIARTWAKRLGYKLCVFHSLDDQGRPIYHTNVMMSVGTTVAVVCLESVENKEERQNLVDTLSKSHEIVEINRAQMNHFCGNVLELKGIKDGKERKLLIMSTKSFNAFTATQKEKLLTHVDELVHADLDTVETIGGGGARCMMGELF